MKRTKRALCMLMGHKWTFSEFEGEKSAHCSRCGECVIHIDNELENCKFKIDFDKHFKRYVDRR